MRKMILAAVGTAALATASISNAAIVVGGVGTTGSSTGSTITISDLDNSTIPETFAFDTIVSDNGAGSPYESFFDFSNDLTGFYSFSITTALNGTITLADINDGMASVFSIVGSGKTLSFDTPTLDAGATYRFTYTSDVPTSGKISGNAAFFPAVPEPATWAMMLIGFAGIGMTMRRRRQPALAQVA